MKLRNIAGALFSLIWLFVQTTPGQVTTATIHGSVTDPSGSGIPAASISVVNEETGMTKNGQTDEHGSYVMTFVPVGKYRITIERDGFSKSQQNDVELSSGQEVALNFTLSLGAVTQTVEVTAATPLVDATSAQQNSTLSATLTEGLPVQGRDFSSLVGLSSGVVAGMQNDLGSGQGSGGPTYGVKVSLNGLPPSSFKFTVDGTDASGDPASSSLSTYQNSNVIRGVSLEAIQEVQVAKNIFSAEISGTMSGNVNIITKSGTNQFHGSLFEVYRAGGLNANDIFVRAKAPQVLNQYGGSVGGPIIRNRLFFFGDIEEYRQSVTTPVSASVATPELRAMLLAAQPVYKAFFDATPLPNQPYAPGANAGVFEGANPSSAYDNHADVRGDYDLTDKQFLNVRYTRSVPKKTVASFSAEDPRTWNSNLQYVTANYTIAASPVTSSQIRFGYSGQNGTRYDGLYIQNIASITGPGFSGFNDEQQNDNGGLFNFEDVTSRELGRHSLKFGGIFQHRRVGFSNPQNPSFAYSSIASLLSNIPDTATYVIGSAPSTTTRAYMGGFIQDDFRFNSSITINLGVRYDYWTVPKERDGRFFNRDGPFGPPLDANHVIKPDYNNFSPRVGIAWALDKDKRTVLKIGSGIFTSEVPIRYVFQNVLVQNNAATPYRYAFTRAQDIQYNIAYGTTTAQVVPLAIGSAPSTGAVNPNYPNPYSIQWTLGISRQLTRTLAMEVQYIGNHSADVGKVWNLNRIDRITGIRPDPALSAFQYADTSDSAHYNALQVSLNKRMAYGLQVSVDYTYSNAMAYGYGDLSDSNSDRTQDNNDLRAEKSRAPYDLQHRFVSNFLYTPSLTKMLGMNQSYQRAIFDGWQFSGILTLEGGLPLEITETSTVPTRPDAVNGISQIDSNYRTTLQYINPAAFALVPLVTLTGAASRPGTLGRFAIRGPGTANMDASIAKNISLRERARLQLRADFFNLANHAEYTTVNTNASSSTFGAITGDRGPRTLQLGIRVDF